MSHAPFVGIDIGGTYTKLARSSSLQAPALVDKFTFPTTPHFKTNYKSIVEYIDNSGPASGIGICIPGNMNRDHTMAVSTKNIPGYINQPLPALLVNRYHCSCRMENDGIGAALAEAYYGTVKKEDFVFIIWGTGLGGTSVVFQDGKPHATKLDRTTYRQSWEDACGGHNLQKKYGKTADQFTDEDWDEIMNAFSKELLTFTQKFKTSRIIFGGGIAYKQSRRLEQVFKRLHQEHQDMPDMRLSQFGMDTGLYGALGLIKTS